MPAPGAPHQNVNADIQRRGEEVLRRRYGIGIGSQSIAAMSPEQRAQLRQDLERRIQEHRRASQADDATISQRLRGVYRVEQQGIAARFTRWLTGGGMEEVYVVMPRQEEIQAYRELHRLQAEIMEESKRALEEYEDAIRRGIPVEQARAAYEARVAKLQGKLQEVQRHQQTLAGLEQRKAQMAARVFGRNVEETMREIQDVVAGTSFAIAAASSIVGGGYAGAAGARVGSAVARSLLGKLIGGLVGGAVGYSVGTEAMQYPMQEALRRAIESLPPEKRAEAEAALQAGKTAGEILGGAVVLGESIYSIGRGIIRSFQGKGGRQLPVQQAEKPAASEAPKTPSTPESPKPPAPSDARPQAPRIEGPTGESAAPRQTPPPSDGQAPRPEARPPSDQERSLFPDGRVRPDRLPPQRQLDMPQIRRREPDMPQLERPESRMPRDLPRRDGGRQMQPERPGAGVATEEPPAIGQERRLPPPEVENRPVEPSTDSRPHLPPGAGGRRTQGPPSQVRPQTDGDGVRPKPDGDGRIVPGQGVRPEVVPRPEAPSRAPETQRVPGTKPEIQIPRERPETIPERRPAPGQSPRSTPERAPQFPERIPDRRPAPGTRPDVRPEPELSSQTPHARKATPAPAPRPIPRPEATPLPRPRQVPEVQPAPRPNAPPAAPKPPARPAPAPRRPSNVTIHHGVPFVADITPRQHRRLTPRPPHAPSPISEAPEILQPPVVAGEITDPHVITRRVLGLPSLSTIQMASPFGGISMRERALFGTAVGAPVAATMLGNGVGDLTSNANSLIGRKDIRYGIEQAALPTIFTTMRTY